MFFKKWRMRRKSRKLHTHLELRAHSAVERADYADRFSVKAFVERYDLRAEVFCLYYGSHNVWTGNYLGRDMADTLWPFIDVMNKLVTGTDNGQENFFFMTKKTPYLTWLRDDTVVTWMIAEIRTPIELRRNELLGKEGEIPRRMEEFRIELEEAKKLEELWNAKLQSDAFKDVAEAHLEITRVERAALEECGVALVRVKNRLEKFFDACTQYIRDLRPLIEVLVLAERTRVLQERRAELEAKTQTTITENVAFVFGKMQELQGKLQVFGEEVGVVVGVDRLPFDPRERMRMLVQSERVLAEHIESIENDILPQSLLTE